MVRCLHDGGEFTGQVFTFPTSMCPMIESPLCFCSPRCALGYLVINSMKHPYFMEMFTEYMSEMYGVTSAIIPAPSPTVICDYRSDGLGINLDQFRDEGPVTYGLDRKTVSQSVNPEVVIAINLADKKLDEQYKQSSNDGSRAVSKRKRDTDADETFVGDDKKSE